MPGISTCPGAARCPAPQLAPRCSSVSSPHCLRSRCLPAELPRQNCFVVNGRSMVWLAKLCWPFRLPLQTPPHHLCSVSTAMVAACGMQPDSFICTQNSRRPSVSICRGSTPQADSQTPKAAGLAGSIQPEISRTGISNSSTPCLHPSGKTTAWTNAGFTPPVTAMAVASLICSGRNAAANNRDHQIPSAVRPGTAMERCRKNLPFTNRSTRRHTAHHRRPQVSRCSPRADCSVFQRASTTARPGHSGFSSAAGRCPASTSKTCLTAVSYSR